ncbi:hypothetical protein pdam_00019266 [Pocillopora damicornis]|uniref:Uncharacterized protein n=1 Tax=Pocillopora damicornis TaxID=46731 RepID=A0A3M6URL7_POCDA|nr:hypothetical protein pdam_00019266 [Pocillopora damicornis]
MGTEFVERHYYGPSKKQIGNRLVRCVFSDNGIYEISFSSLTRVRVICLGVSYISLSSSIVSYITAILYVDPKATDPALEGKLQRSSCLC